jgi:SH3 domain-containing YSC84-like protein 1
MTGKRRTAFARPETQFHRNTEKPLFGCPLAPLDACEVFMKARILTISFFAAASLFAAESSTDTRLRHSMEAFQDTIKSPDKGIPQDLLNKAQCVMIVPDLVKGAFFVGGKYGRGFASCRHGGWSSPAAVRIEGGSFGLQLGGSSTDFIMLVMNRRGMDRLLGDKFTIGADIEGAAGPVGRETSAQTDAVLHAEILTWSRARGLFGGISLEGATLRPDGGENRKLYGHEISNREILEAGVPTPTAGKPFVAMLNRQSSPARTASRSQK